MGSAAANLVNVAEALRGFESGCFPGWESFGSSLEAVSAFFSFLFSFMFASSVGYLPTYFGNTGRSFE